ncbi:MAG: hypothetical protein KDK26_07840 [Roseivivax sp.]|nr:hypothetical protein [Roseivivax sp.]
MGRRTQSAASAALIMPDCVNLSAGRHQSIAARVLREIERTSAVGAIRASLRFETVVAVDENGPYGPALTFTVSDAAGGRSGDAAALVLSRILKAALPESRADLIYWGPNETLLDIGEFAALCLRLSAYESRLTQPAEPRRSARRRALKQAVSLRRRVQSVLSRLTDRMQGQDLRLATLALGVTMVMILLAAHGGLQQVAALLP